MADTKIVHVRIGGNIRRAYVIREDSEYLYVRFMSRARGGGWEFCQGAKSGDRIPKTNLVKRTDG